MTIRALRIEGGGTQSAPKMTPYELKFKKIEGPRFSPYNKELSCQLRDLHMNDKEKNYKEPP